MYAICDFQYQAGLIIDSKIGNQTIDAMLLWDLYKETAKNGVLSESSSPSDIKVLQQFLKKQGYYSGNLTGKYDDNTKAAVELFQETYGLTANGIADESVIRQLRINEIKSGASAQAAALEKAANAYDSGSVSSSSSSASGSYSSSGGYGYSSIGDCWAHSAWYSSKLRTQGYSTRIVQYSTSLSSRHRSVQVYKNGKWVDADYSKYNKIYSATSGSSNGKVVG